jgi:hypothetical protein
MPELLMTILLGIALALLVLAAIYLNRGTSSDRHSKVPDCPWPFPPPPPPLSSLLPKSHFQDVCSLSPQGEALIELFDQLFDQRTKPMSEPPVKKARIEIYPRRTKDPKRRFGIRVIALNGEPLPDDYRDERDAFRGAEDFRWNVNRAVIVKKVKGRYVPVPAAGGAVVE